MVHLEISDRKIFPRPSVKACGNNPVGELTQHGHSLLPSPPLGINKRGSITHKKSTRDVPSGNRSFVSIPSEHFLRTYAASLLPPPACDAGQFT
jgi:hypothetical protein